jgi:hypothetical protein
VSADPRADTSFAASVGVHPPADPRPEAATPQVAGGLVPARKFIGRVAQLRVSEVREAVEAWRETMRDESLAWFAAEDEVADALVRSALHGAQKALLLHVADVFCEMVWYREGDEPTPGTALERRVQATEASGQYLTTLSMLAVLVRRHLEPATFDLLYRPFATAIPFPELARE